MQKDDSGYLGEIISQIITGRENRAFVRALDFLEAKSSL